MYINWTEESGIDFKTERLSPKWTVLPELVTGRRLTAVEPKVIHNQASHRYEIWVAGKRVGHADYSLVYGERHFVHTETDPAEQGKGFAAVLMREALRDVRENSKDKVVPVCSYVVMYMQRHPETHDLLKDTIEDAVAACALPEAEND